MTNVLSIASTTYREAARQPVFWVLLTIFGVLVLVSGEITLFSLGDEQVMIREMGQASIALCTFLLILLTATNAIRSEIESQTLLTLLSKPVGRPSVLLGKLLGILGAVAGALVILTLALTLTLWLNGGLRDLERAERKERYEDRRVWMQLAHTNAPETGLSVQDIRTVRILAGSTHILTPPKRGYLGKVCHIFLPTLIPLAQGLYLVLLQCLVLIAVSACLSIRFGFHLTATLSFAVFTLGHLSPYLFQQLTAENSGLLARAFGRAFYRVVPNLQNYNLSGIAARQDGRIPWEYLAGATAQTGLYVGALVLVGIVLFERTEAVSPSDQA